MDTTDKVNLIFIARLVKTYPNLNPEKEIHRADLWLHANKKLKQNYKRFISNWFLRNADK